MARIKAQVVIAHFNAAFIPRNHTQRDKTRFRGRRRYIAPQEQEHPDPFVPKSVAPFSNHPAFEYWFLSRKYLVVVPLMRKTLPIGAEFRAVALAIADF
jgi:hypothetical protein